jgi:hypothetical protein
MRNVKGYSAPITNVSVNDRKRQTNGPSLASKGTQLFPNKPRQKTFVNRANVTGWEGFRVILDHRLCYGHILNTAKLSICR